MNDETVPNIEKKSLLASSLAKIEADLEKGDFRSALQRVFQLCKYFYNKQIEIANKVADDKDFHQLSNFYENTQSGIILRIMNIIDSIERKDEKPYVLTVEGKSVLDRCKIKIAHIGNFIRLQEKINHQKRRDFDNKRQSHSSTRNTRRK